MTSGSSPDHESSSWTHHSFRPRDAGPADPARFIERSAHSNYPRTSAYDPTWVFLNHMGPNVLWLTEWLTEVLDLQPGMRVLDLGCGTATSSIFLAREFGVHVWAADFWMPPDENGKRIAETDVADRVFPISVGGARASLRCRFLRRDRECGRVPLLRHRHSLSRVPGALRACGCADRHCGAVQLGRSRPHARRHPTEHGREGRRLLHVSQRASGGGGTGR